MSLGDDSLANERQRHHQGGVETEVFTPISSADHKGTMAR